MKYIIEVEIPDGETMDVQKPGLGFKGFVYVKTEQVEDVNMGLIDRQAAIDVFRQLADDEWNKRTGASWADGYESAIEILEELPSAERKKGRWILVKGSNSKDYHKCSQCLHTQEITGVKNYCAVCGAEMRRGEGG